MQSPRQIAALFTLAGIVAFLTACSAPIPRASTGESASPSTEPTSAASATTAEPSFEQIVGTRVHFTTGSTVVEVTISEDTAATRDFLSMLPMTLDFQDYAGMEKISYPPRGFDTTGNEGMAPQPGDLFSYAPWSNLGFFYDTGSLGHSRDLVRLGTTDDLDAVMDLDGKQVTIAIVDSPRETP